MAFGTSHQAGKLNLAALSVHCDLRALVVGNIVGRIAGPNSTRFIDPRGTSICPLFCLKTPHKERWMTRPPCWFSCLVEADSALIAQDEYLKWLRE